jgi:hypothetical protein
MKALILRGKHKGEEVEIGQWANDWFTLSTGNVEIDRKPMSPTSLAFTYESIRKIRKAKGIGMFNALYVAGMVGRPTSSPSGNLYIWTFRRRP